MDGMVFGLVQDFGNGPSNARNVARTCLEIVATSYTLIQFEEKCNSRVPAGSSCQFSVTKELSVVYELTSACFGSRTP